MIEVRISHSEQRRGVYFSDKLRQLGFTQLTGEWSVEEDFYSMDKVFHVYPTRRDLLTKKFTLED